MSDTIQIAKPISKVTTERCAHCNGSGKRWIDYRDGKKSIREMPCRQCSGRGFTAMKMEVPE